MTRRARVVWCAGLFAYAAAVLQRTSFGVAGLAAVDRFGSRVMVSGGALLMAVGQGTMAAAHDVPLAMVARILVGAGDAMTFGSVVRLVPAWFPASRVPLFTQLTGLLGQAGQVLAAVPLAALLRGPGWSVAFGAAAAFAGAAFVVAMLLVKDRPDGVEEVLPQGRAPMLGQVAAVMRHPGTRLGMWSHWLSGCMPTVFAMMWGLPYLVEAEGLSPQAASGLLSLFVVLGVVVGPTLGVLTQRHPLRRSNLVLAVAACNILPWVAVLLWPGRAPMWLLVVLVVGLSTGGPGSNIGFDFARSFNASHRLGAATGVVIMGSFLSGLACILAVGLVLDATAVDGHHTLAGFWWAMAVQLPVCAIGLVGLLRSRTLTRRRWHAEEGVVVPPWREAVARELRRRGLRQG